MSGSEKLFGAAHDLLRRFYGYKFFRPAQEPVVRDLLAGRDTLAIMPTGAGKSICFQIPALLLRGITLVFSPLISLMKDQVDALCAQGIPAAFLNSTLSQEEADARLAAVARGEIRLLYIAPEKLESGWFQSMLRRLPIALIAVDEAHCLSQWGHDFRPSYRGIAAFIKTLPRRPIIGAFTATATPEVRDDIMRLLELSSPAVHVSGFDRPNLYFEVQRGERKDTFLRRFIDSHLEDSGIIYCATRKKVDSVWEHLQKRGIPAGRYHAGLSDEERKRMQEDFLFDRLPVMVATNAFGMGIDKSNVRYVIHYNMPKNLEGYYQEAGRAGRDGEPGECILLFAAEDVRTQQYLIDVSTEDETRKAGEYKRLQKMIDYCHTTGCLRQFIIEYFGELAPSPHCDNCGSCKGDTVLTDLTVDAQKVLSCIFRMRERFGITTVAQVLAGASTQAVAKNQFDKLSTYGLFHERTMPEIKLLIQRLVATGYIELTASEYPVLKLLPVSYAVLKGQKKVLLDIPKEKKKLKAPSTGLFEHLRAVRKAIAACDHIPPYVVFSDATLRDMVAVHPTTLDEMRTVKGVGEVKLERYGSEFLEAIQNFKG